jgi:hypothetical protein
MPTTLSGRFVWVAICTIGSEEVFVASTTSSRVIPSSVRKISSFVSSCSVAASIARSESAMSS